MKISNEHLDAAFEIPAVEMLNAIEQLDAARALGGRGLVIHDEIENVACTTENVGEDRRIIIQPEYLRHEARHQLTASSESPGIRFENSGCNLQEGRLASAVTAHEANSLLLMNAECCVIENGLRPVANDEMTGIGDDDGSEIWHEREAEGRTFSIRDPTSNIQWTRMVDPVLDVCSQCPRNHLPIRYC